MNTKYIASSAVKKSVFSGDEIYLVFTEKKSFLLILYSMEKYIKALTNFFPGLVSFNLISSVCLLGITLSGNLVFTLKMA